MEMVMIGIVSTIMMIQRPENGHTNLKLCLNPLPRNFLIVRLPPMLGRLMTPTRIR